MGSDENDWYMTLNGYQTLGEHFIRDVALNIGHFRPGFESETCEHNDRRERQPAVKKR